MTALPPPALRRLDGWTVWFVGLAVAAFVLLVLLGRGMTFFHDEWQFIDGRGGWDLATFMAPHNEHWSLVPLAIYKVMLATVGLRSYVPYQVVVVLLHVLVAGALFHLVRREATPIVAVCAAGLFLVLGTGAEDLFWPAEIGWNAATAAGAWALVFAIDRRSTWSPWVSAVLLLVAVASSGVGLFFLVVVGLALLLTAQGRRSLWVLVPAAVAYLAWYLAFGRSAVRFDVLAPTNLSAVPDYVVVGFGNAMGRLTGWGDQPGLVLAVLLTVVTVWRLLGPRPVLLGTVLGLAGVLAQFGITGLARARVGAEQAQSAHYVYVAAFFLLLAIGSWLGTLRIDRRRPRSLAVLGVLSAIALSANLLALMIARASFIDAAERTRAAITVLTRFGGSAAVSADAALFPIPGPARLERIFATYGSPLTDALAPAPEPSPAALDRALFQVVADTVAATPTQLPADSSPPAIEGSMDVTTVPAADCIELQPTGPNPWADFTMPAGASLFVGSETGGPARIYLAQYAAFQEEASVAFTIPAGSFVSLPVPDLGPGVTWRVRVEVPSAEPTRLCLK